MIRYHVGCLPVVDERARPIGIITRSDLVDHLDYTGRTSSEKAWTRPGAQPRVAGDVMMPVSFTLPDTSSVAHAAAVMMSKDTHHVLVVNAAGVLVGVASSKDIVAWVARHHAAGSEPIGPPAWHRFQS
jgi:CBS domain-containing protein